MRPAARSRFVAGLATAGLLLTAAPAAAHPYFTDGATVPADSLASVTLDLAHGCGEESEGEGAPTTEVALEVPQQVGYLEPAEADGYELEVEGDPGAVPDVVVWTATDDGVPAPQFDLDIVVEGDEGDEIFVSVFQACGDQEERWVGTPEAPADDPAVGLTLAAPDPDSPPPPAEPEAEETVDVEAEETQDQLPEEVEEEPATSVEDLPTEPPEDGGGGVPWLWIVLGALVVAGVGAMVGTRRRRPVPVVDDPADQVDPDAGGPTP
jgi:uncharacterized protein YcnI